MATFFLGAMAVAFVVAACGSETAGDVADAGPNDAATGDAANDVLVIVSDASSDADPPADGPFACGTTTCGATQYCVNPCCGGAPGQDSCTPPPPYCIDDSTKAPVGCMKQGHSFMCLCA